VYERTLSLSRQVVIGRTAALWHQVSRTALPPEWLEKLDGRLKELHDASSTRVVPLFTSPLGLRVHPEQELVITWHANDPEGGAVEILRRSDPHTLQKDNSYVRLARRKVKDVLDRFMWSESELARRCHLNRKTVFRACRGDWIRHRTFARILRTLNDHIRASGDGPTLDRFDLDQSNQ